jgi:diguanylate cyclase (GGDEF)-like protein
MQREKHQPLILIIEDNPGDLRILGDLIKHLGEVIFATSGESGLFLAQQRKPDLILLDVELPDINGFRICNEIKRHPDTEDTAIIFVTAHNDEATEVAALEAGALDFITKPFVPPVVRARVKTHITLKHQANALQELANRDGLTEVYSRRYFEHQARLEINRHARQCSPLSLVLMDIDDFKAYNDNYGHLQGDHCLKSVAQTLQNNSRRPGEFIARFGGEEFVAVLPNTNQREAQKYGRWICERIVSLALPHAHSRAMGFVSISAGIVTATPDPSTQLDSLIAEADQALYKAKDLGRNRFCLATINQQTFAESIFKNPITTPLNSLE